MRCRFTFCRNISHRQSNVAFQSIHIPSSSDSNYILFNKLYFPFFYFIILSDEEEIAEFGTYVTAGDEDEEGRKNLLKIL